MEAIKIEPSRRLLTKYRLITTLIFVPISCGLLVPGLAIGTEAGGGGGALAGFGITVFLLLLGLGVTQWLVGQYFHSLHYEIHADEVIVRGGIITHSVKHVPFRTVTNITVRRDLFDRFLFEIGTVDVQTAGASQTTTRAEESLTGLNDYEGIYTVIATALKRYRGVALAPDQASLADGEDPVVAELRQIRALLAGAERAGDE